MLAQLCSTLHLRYVHAHKQSRAEEPADGLDIIRKAQEHIIKKDQTLLLAKVSNYQYLHEIAECVGWKLWDHVLIMAPQLLKA